MDIFLLIFGVLLATTLLAFFLGLIHYPYGWLIFIFLIMMRLGQLNKKDRLL